MPTLDNPRPFPPFSHVVSSILHCHCKTANLSPASGKNNTQLRFKPAYNPYTEPSMEIFGYHPDLGKWTEIGNSGMFRPEMLRPMGLPENVRVIAWGLSLERPTMIKYRINNIRDLFGHKADIKKQKVAPMSVF
jgi:phenylalanyl-tRNA synthetase alpha chain